MSPSHTPRHHSTWRQLLQIAGAVVIVAFHTEAPFSQAGWAAVELFFVMAGMHMTSALGREQALASYAGSRVWRLFPEVALVWIATLALVLLGRGTTGMHWFLGAAPFQLQNLTPLFFRYDLPSDAVFGPLWFVGSLIQLQILLFALKAFLKTAKPRWILVAALGAGITCRLAFAVACGHPRNLDGAHAGILYCMPFCHLEAIVLGVLLARGDLAILGRRLPWVFAAVLVLGFLNYRFSSGQIKAGSLGFEFPLRTNFSYLWGYPALAFAAAALCAREGGLVAAIDGGRLPAWISRAATQLAALTYGVYCFHGLIIATGLNAAGMIPHTAAGRTLIFIITLLEAFAIAGIFTWLKDRFCSGNHMPARNH